jgi:hypothetical protein
MNPRHHILSLLIILTSGTSHALAQQAATAPARKATAAQANRVDIFVGSGTAGWLPKTKSTALPTAAAIETTAQSLGSRLRNLDPFGLSTFPREEDKPASPAQVVRAAERITLNQALQTLKVTGINLAKKEMLIGGQSVFQGDVMMLSFKNEVFLAQVLEVGATEIHFRDVNRLEAGVLPHTIMHRLNLESMQNRSRSNALQGKVTPMQPYKP